MADTPSGHIERLSSGSFRVDVYGGIDPITKQRIRFRQTCKTEVAVQLARQATGHLILRVCDEVGKDADAAEVADGGKDGVLAGLTSEPAPGGSHAGSTSAPHVPPAAMTANSPQPTPARPRLDGLLREQPDAAR